MPCSRNSRTGSPSARAGEEEDDDDDENDDGDGDGEEEEEDEEEDDDDDDGYDDDDDDEYDDELRADPTPLLPGWRLPLCAPGALGACVLIGAPCLPPSPATMVRAGRYDDAFDLLVRLAGGRADGLPAAATISSSAAPVAVYAH